MVERINWDNTGAVTKACEVLKKGGVLVYPTDTLYGFGCDAKNEQAIHTINTIKNRSGPMSVIAPSKDAVETWLKLPGGGKMDVLKKLGGATTVIVPVKDNIVSKNISGNNQTLGIRIPDHPFCQKLSQNYSNPVTTTSVNRNKQGPLTSPDEIIKEFSHEIQLVIEDGIISGVASTVYLFEKNKWTVLRS